MTQRTALCLVNVSGQDITRIQISQTSGFASQQGPEAFLQGRAIAQNESLGGYVELDGSSSPFTVELTFADGSTLSFSDDQQHAKEKNVGVLLQTNTLEVWRSCGGDVNSGSHGTNGIYIRSRTVPDHSQWMAQLRRDQPNVRLCDLVLPGSHDAGMFQTEDYNLGGGGEWAKTQNLSMAEQLKAGARYFDLRICKHNDHLVTYHGETGYGAYGGSLGTIISEVKTFINSPAGQGETVILKFSHTYKNATQRVVEVVKTLGSSLFQSTAIINLAQTKLSDLKGKVVAVFDEEFADYWQISAGIFPYHDTALHPTNLQAQSLTVYDHYADDVAFEDMAGDQRSKVQAYAGWGKDYLFLLSWTLTGASAVRDIEVLAGMANPWLPAELAKIVQQSSPRPNIVYLDFLDAYLAGVVIEMNKR